MLNTFCLALGRPKTNFVLTPNFIFHIGFKPFNPLDSSLTPHLSKYYIHTIFLKCFLKSFLICWKPTHVYHTCFRSTSLLKLLEQLQPSWCRLSPLICQNMLKFNFNWSNVTKSVLWCILQTRRACQYFVSSLMAYLKYLLTFYLHAN